MVKYFYICFGLFLFSCKGQNQKKENNTVEFKDSIEMPIQNQVTSHKEDLNPNLDSISKEILMLNKKNKLSLSDTLKYKFSLEDVGTEGNEGIAYYISDSLVKIEFNVCTSMWRYEIHYYIAKMKIKVIENTYNISNYSSEKNTSIKETIYTIDFNGKVIGNADKERLDIFQEFRKIVPFKLK